MMSDDGLQDRESYFRDEKYLEAKEPSFLVDRVDAFYQRTKDWHGSHIFSERVPGKDDVQVFTNDYLCLTRHPKIVDAQVAALLNKQSGDLRSAVFLREDDGFQRGFELAMAKFAKSEDAMAAPSGWHANTGLLQAIANKDLPVYIDMIAHMSLWEGIHSASAKAVPFRHNDVDHLKSKLERYGSGIVVIDSIYSTNGDLAPIADIVALAKEHDCIIIVDESHSLGTHGDDGSGLVVQLGLQDVVDFRTSSLSKAFAGRGGIILCSSRIREYMVLNSHPTIFSSAIQAHDLAGFRATIKLLQEEGWRRERLHHNADYIRSNLAELGYNVEESKSQIIALEAGPESQTILLRDALEDGGVFGAVFCPPATGKNRSLVRLSINSGLKQAQLDKLVATCRDIRDRVDMWNWPSTKRRKIVPEHFVSDDTAKKATDDSGQQQIAASA